MRTSLAASATVLALALVTVSMTHASAAVPGEDPEPTATTTGPAAAPALPAAPGTATRPVLTRAEAAAFTPSAYFARAGTVTALVDQPWQPRPVASRAVADYVVDTTGADGTYRTVQAAVDAAVGAEGAGRRYIEVRPGTYTGVVLVPAGAPPLTIFGGGRRPSEVRLELAVTSTMTPAQYAEAVAASAPVSPTSPARAMFETCTLSTAATVGNCASVVWSAAPDFQLADLTVTNTTPDSVGPGTAQALAVRTDGDRTQLERLRLVSRQDTLFLNTATASTIARVRVRDSLVVGDVDYVFGRATAVLEGVEFHSVTTRRPAGAGYVLAPATAPGHRYGFLVTRSTFTADAGYVATPNAYLGRAWDAGARTTGYLPGTTPNGQLVVRDSVIGAGYRTDDPWGPAATTSRPFSTDLSAGRDLDSPAFNRLWEYRNRLAG